MWRPCRPVIDEAIGKYDINSLSLLFSFFVTVTTQRKLNCSRGNFYCAKQSSLTFIGWFLIYFFLIPLSLLVVKFTSQLDGFHLNFFFSIFRKWLSRSTFCECFSIASKYCRRGKLHFLPWYSAQHYFNPTTKYN